MRQHLKAIRLLVICGVCLATTLIYGGIFSTYFLGDDLNVFHYIVHQFREGKLSSFIWNELVSPPYRVGFFYRPFFYFSFIGDYLLWEYNPMGWHLTNLLLHLVNVVLLWKLINRMMEKYLGQKTIIVAGATALIFALRPSSPEVVAWPAVRSYEFVLLGFLVAFLTYLRANGRWKPSYFLAIGAYLFALGSNEAGVTLLCGLLALHLAGFISIEHKVGENQWLPWVRQTVKGMGPFVMILLIYFVWRLFVFGTPFTVYQNTSPIDLNNPAWRAAKLYTLRFFLAPSIEMTLLAKIFLLVTSIQVLIGFIAAWHSTAGRRMWIFGICWLLTFLLTSAKHLFIGPKGDGARLLYVSGAPLAVLMAAPLVTLLEPSCRENRITRPISSVGAVAFVLLVFSSAPLLINLLQPWLEAGRSMKVLPPAIAIRAETVQKGGFAILMIPDHHHGAMFGRNGQGALMEPPIQSKLLTDRVLVVTPPTLGEHAPRLSMSSQQTLRLECWCWSIEKRSFIRLPLSEYGPDEWLKKWKTALSNAGFPSLADELSMLYN